MKIRILTIFTIVVMFLQTNGQNNMYVPTPFVPLNIDFYMRAAATMEARYEQNLNYRDKLIDWIFDLKTKTNEQTFLSNMDYYYKKLRAMDGQDFNLLGDKLDIIKQNIKEEIDAYNKRIKEENDAYNKKVQEAPKLLWESGNNKLKSQDYKGAITDYTELISMNPDYPYTYRNRGIAYENLSKYSLALSDLNKFIDKIQNDVFAYSTRGWAKYYLNDFAGALADFNMQIELDKDNSVAYYNRGSAKSRLGDNYGAISDYSKSIEINPTFSMAYNNRGWAKYELKKYSEALKDINKAIVLDSNNWVAFDSRQETKFAMNNFKGCIEDCNKAIAINPKCSNSYFIKGRAYYKLANKAKACDSWSKAGELGKVEAYEYISKYCK